MSAQPGFRTNRLWLVLLGLMAGSLILATVLEFDPLHEDSRTGRWYSQQQVDEGAVLYARHCASCHGVRAEATPAWTRPDAQGFYPPPPLNGSAHAWHHPLPILKEMILNGTNGRMPAWRQTLDEEQVESIIAWFQSLWPDEGYQAWQRTHNR
ncbi:c-type cytochrome [Aestuariirhabdus litorea]|uniref:Cytochrome c n=1 Tax=Aestuariirhabdus litorea TaxID=2528527 RepID=A0A3P3VLW0_9GAMM|nr:cytochrome c [Aestuariirhabdus litorea]RRJ82646.1 cytochrome c [Aestuariirhabdus litorea]RWW92807.1 c-type cytochrome [Endozoicomonadaceae bacterium GTF-13]